MIPNANCLETTAGATPVDRKLAAAVVVTKVGMAEKAVVTTVGVAEKAAAVVATSVDAAEKENIPGLIPGNMLEEPAGEKMLGVPREKRLEVEGRLTEEDKMLLLVEEGKRLDRGTRLVVKGKRFVPRLAEGNMLVDEEGRMLGMAAKLVVTV